MIHMDPQTRLRLAVALIGKQKDAAGAIGITDARLSNYLRAVNKPGREVLEKLAAAANVRPAWLIDGTGPMMTEAEAPKPAVPDNRGRTAERPDAALSRLSGAPPAPRGAAAASIGSQELLQALQAMQTLLNCYLKSVCQAPPPDSPGTHAEVSAARAAAAPRKPGDVISADDYLALSAAKRRHYVPIVAHSTAGLPSVSGCRGLPAGAADEYAFAPGSPPGTFAVGVKGESMLPDFGDGDVVLVGSLLDPLADLPLHALVFYEDQTENIRHTVKMVTAEGDDVCLRPLNPAFGGEERIPRSRVRAVFGIMCRRP